MFSRARAGERSANGRQKCVFVYEKKGNVNEMGGFCAIKWIALRSE
jgi:hypothetical protein